MENLERLECPNRSNVLKAAADTVLFLAKAATKDPVGLLTALSYLVPNIFPPKSAVVYWADKQK